MSTTEIQLKALVESLTTGTGLLAVSVAVLLFAAALMSRQTKWWLMAAMLFVSTLSFNPDEANVVRKLIFPLDSLRYQGRGVTLGLLFLMLVGFLVMPRGWRRRYFIPGTLVYLLFQLLMSTMIMFRADFTKGAASIVIFLFVFVVLGVALPHALQSWEAAMSAVRALAGFGILFAGLNMIQALVSPSIVIGNGRFQGTTGNSQLVGQVAAMTLVPVAYLISRPGKSKMERLAMGAAAGLLAIMLAWSGARMGLLMAVVGMGVLFRTRLSRLVGAALLVGGFAVVITMWVFPDSNVVSGHLFATTDTRSAVWMDLLEEFLSHPLMGVLYKEWHGIRESSYLSVAARYGLVGLVPFLLALLLIARSAWQVRRARWTFPDAMMADLVMAGLAQIAFGAFFEGYMVATLGAPMLMWFSYLALLGFLKEWADVSESSEWQEESDVSEFMDHVEDPQHLSAGAW